MTLFYPTCLIVKFKDGNFYLTMPFNNAGKIRIGGVAEKDASFPWKCLWER